MESQNGAVCAGGGTTCPTCAQKALVAWSGPDRFITEVDVVDLDKPESLAELPDCAHEAAPLKGCNGVKIAELGGLPPLIELVSSGTPLYCP